MTARPSIEVLTHWIRQDDDPSNHWEWLVDLTAKHPRRFNERNQAIISWSSSTKYRRGIFVVARVFLEARETQLTRGTRFALNCGLSQCVNPDHWRRVDPSVLWRMQVLESGVWQLVRIVTNKPAQREIVVHVQLGDAIHLVAIAPLVQRSLAPPRAVCGVELSPTSVVVTASPVTCKTCV